MPRRFGRSDRSSQLVLLPFDARASRLGCSMRLNSCNIKTNLWERFQSGKMRRIGLKNCPYCGSSEIYIASSKTFWQKISVLLLLRLVRCQLCMRRHLRPIFFPAAKRPSTRPVPRKPAEVVSGKKAPASTAPLTDCGVSVVVDRCGRKLLSSP